VELPQYRRIFRDIVRGFSSVNVYNSNFYIKHLSALDQVDIDDVQERYSAIAKERGIPSEAEIIQRLTESGEWDESKFKKINSLEVFIASAQKSKSQLVLKSAIDKQNKSIESAQKEIESLINERKNLIGVSAESYSEKRSNDYYIIKSFYEDEDLKQPVFPDEESYNDLYLDEISEFVSAYNKTFQNFEELTIQKMILQDFYYIYFPFSDDTVGFFGNPVCHLTYNQLKLIVYTKIFKNIFERNENIPDSIKKDPRALLDYGNISDEAKEKMKKQIAGNKDGSTLFGATEEDYEYAGLKKPSDQIGTSLTKAAEKKGGSLNMQDLMELSGIRTK